MWQPFPLLLTLLLLNPLTLLQAQQKCDFSLCNYEGECVLQNKQPTCKCIGSTFFQGPRCNEPVDNCKSKPCFNNAPCTSVLGLFFCGPCAPGYAGTKCSFREKDFATKFYLHYNRYGYYGEEQKFLITVETLGSAAFGLELETDNNQIEAFTTFSNVPLAKFQWQRSENLVRVAQNLGLRHAKMMPYKRGFYHVSYGRFWEVGLKQLTFIIFDGATSSKLFHNFEYALLIVLPESAPCVPQVQFPQCGNPRELLHVDIARFNIFELKVVKRCEPSGSLLYHWGVYTTLGTTLLHDFGQMHLPLIIVPPYSLWFNRHGEALQVYSVQVEVREHTSGGYQRTLARCYIFVMPKPVLALITGGDERAVYVADSFVMDGSRSLDYALAPDSAQRMLYHWDCTSADDPSNSFCHANIGSGSTVAVSANALEAGKAYTFNFTVRSRVNYYSADSAQQVVRAVSDRRPLYIAINCVRNCVLEKYVPGQLLHLEAVCLSCASSWTGITYAWSVSGSSVGTKKHLVYTPSAVPVLNVELAVTGADRQGNANVKLRQNKPPSGGSCKIQPSSGAEYATEFYIECSDFTDSDGDVPLSYQFMAGDFPLDRTNAQATHLRLPQVSSVKVIVCDFLFACNEQSVPVSVSPLQVPTDAAAMQAFLKQPANNLQQLMQQGNRERFMILLLILLSGTTSLEVAECVYDEIKTLQLRTLLEVEQMTEITKALADKLKPLDYKCAALFAELFGTLASGLRLVVDDGEIQELLPASYKTLSDDLTDMLSDFSVEQEKIPEAQSNALAPPDIDNPLLEAHIDELDFDVTVLQRVNAWMRASEGLNVLLQLLGTAAAYMHEPEEPPLLVDKNGLKMQVFSISGTQEREIRTTNNAVTVFLPSALLAELQEQLRSDQLLLQILTMQKNPFWWYPDETPVSTCVFYCFVYSRRIKLNIYIYLTQPFEFTMRPVAATTPTPAATPASGMLASYWDMPIYRILIPTNSLLLVKFVAAHGDLRVALQLSVPPRGYQVRRSPRLVRATSSNATFVLTNDQGRMQPAYLAMLAAQPNGAGASFEFTLELRRCQSFDFHLEDPRWTSCGCLPVLASKGSDNVTCRCHTFSSFAGKVEALSVDSVLSERTLLQSVPINWYLVLFYAVVALCLLLLFLFARRNLGKNRDQLVTELSPEDANKNFDVIIRVNTGSHWNAGTTANVSLTFVMARGPPRRFDIYQDPEEPHLTPNSMCSLKLPLSSNEFALPLKIDVQHDGAGRYPTWYCESIELEDVRTGYRHTFRVHKWIHHKLLLTAPMHQTNPESRCATFMRHWKRMHINWFLLQPIFGPDKSADSPLNRSERTCLWIAKVSVSICIVACYFGRTTLETYEEERERYHSLDFNAWHLLWLCLVAYLAGLLVQFGLEYLLLHS